MRTKQIAITSKLGQRNLPTVPAQRYVKCMHTHEKKGLCVEVNCRQSSCWRDRPTRSDW